MWLIHVGWVSECTLVHDFGCMRPHPHIFLYLCVCMCMCACVCLFVLIAASAIACTCACRSSFIKKCYYLENIQQQARGSVCHASSANSGKGGPSSSESPLLALVLLFGRKQHRHGHRQTDRTTDNIQSHRYGQTHR